MVSPLQGIHPKPRLQDLTLPHVLHPYRGAGKSLAQQGRKQARKHVREARDFNNIKTRVVITFFFILQRKEPKEIHGIMTETLA